MNCKKDEDEVGSCPFCGGVSLDYGALEIEDGQLYYPWVCDDCNAEGKEWYELNFIKQEIVFDGETDEEKHQRLANEAYEYFSKLNLCPTKEEVEEYIREAKEE